jgi:hypothetical protein
MMQPYGNNVQGEREEFGLLLPAMLPRARHDHHLDDHHRLEPLITFPGMRNMTF